MTTRPFPDVQLALCDLFEPLAPAGVATPSDLQALAKFLRVARNGGTDDGITDRPRVDVDAFAPTYQVARDLAEDARQLLLNGPHWISGVLLDLSRTLTGPHEVPWGDPNVRRFTGSYEISVRR